MKYMQNGGFQGHPLMKMTLLWTVAFLTGLWVTNFLFFFTKMGIRPQAVIDYYCGSETLFTQPRSFESMLEVTHFHLPMMAIVVLILTHLLIFSPWPHHVKVWFISASFGSALIEEGSGWLVRFVNPNFAILKILSFFTFQALFAFLLLSLTLYLTQKPAKEASPKHRSK